MVENRLVPILLRSNQHHRTVLTNRLEDVSRSVFTLYKDKLFSVNSNNNNNNNYKLLQSRIKSEENHSSIIIRHYKERKNNFEGKMKIEQLNDLKKFQLNNNKNISVNNNNIETFSSNNANSNGFSGLNPSPQRIKDVALASNGRVTNHFNNFGGNFIETSPGTSRRMTAKLIDGKKISAEIRSELRDQIDQWVSEGNRRPQLTAVLIGSDPASCTYVRNKMKAAADVGIESVTKELNDDITEEQLLEIIDELNNDDRVDGILVQLPVPGHINERKICNAVSCDKDVDGFNERNVGRLCLDMKTLIPCTPLGVQELLKRTNIETFGKNAVVVGRSKNVGMPISMLLHADGRNDTCAMDATVTICHRFTPPEELARFCRLADIIITATGVPGLIKADMVKPGACVIDVGITRITDEQTGKTKLVGDVDFDAVKEIAGHITPVPGGVGPMTVAMLMRNTFVAAKNLAKKRKQTFN